MSVTWSGETAYGNKAFTGREWDPEIGLYYYRARYYGPAVGRFPSEDPIGWWGSGSLYSYVDNNPVNFIDPRGEAAVTINSNRTVPYKPEGKDGAIKLCPPGATCDADGVYPPACDRYPVKIVDGCTAEVSAGGWLWVWCPLFKPDAPDLKRKFPFFGQMVTGGRTSKDFHDEHKDWPPPNNKPNCDCGS